MADLNYDIEEKIYEAISCGDTQQVQQLLTNHAASTFSSYQACRFLGRAVASRMTEMLRILLKHGFHVTDLDTYTRQLPATLGHREMARLLQ